MTNGKAIKVFDWDKAVRLILAAKAKKASAGLAEDWGWTSGQILRDGVPVYDHGTYLSSPWATPVIKIDHILYPCWASDSERPDWHHHTRWPSSSLALLPSHDPAVYIVTHCPHCEKRVNIRWDLNDGCLAVCPRCKREMTLCEECRQYGWDGASRGRPRLLPKAGSLPISADCSRRSRRQKVKQKRSIPILDDKEVLL